MDDESDDEAVVPDEAREDESGAMVLYKARLKAALLDYLQHRAYVRLAPSAIAGVGVFAVIDIPAGVNPFVPPNAHLCARELSIAVRADELAAVPPAVVQHLGEFCAEMDDDDDSAQKAPDGGWQSSAASGRPVYYGINATGLVSMDTSWYLNHSEEPNIESLEAEEEGQFSSYRTMRPIKAGEELVTDYREELESMYADIIASRRQVANSKIS